MDVTAQGKTESGEVRSVTVPYEFGETLKETTDLFGDEIVHGHAVGSIKISLQALVRRDIAAGKSGEEISAHAAAWKPGMPSERKVKDPTKNILDAWPKMSEEQRTAFLRQLKEIK
jgi:hypothetical protein